MTLLIPCVALAPSFGTAAFAQAPSVTGEEFVAKASAGNTVGIEPSKRALHQDSNAEATSHAPQAIAVREKGPQDVAGKSSPKAETTLDGAHQAEADNLKGFGATDFDTIYEADQIAARNETVSLPPDDKANGQDGALEGRVDDTLTAVKGHKATIEAM